ncbi:MAG: HAD family phosphatase [Phycisphaeraceae bacterium]|nr:HAD family phosphatase [Phycisphaeraceae bacterium]
MSGRAIIFDFDGVILDTEMTIYESWRRQYEKHGHPLPLDNWITVLGMPAHQRDFHAELEALCGCIFDRAELKAQRLVQIRAALNGRPPRPGITDWLEQAKRLDVALAVASGSGHGWVDEHLCRLGLIDYFAAVICSEDTSAHKPGPEPFLAAARALQIDPRQCVVVEDSPNGIRAAKAAGMFAIAYPTDMTRGQDFASLGADIITESLDQLDLKDVLAGSG